MWMLLLLRTLRTPRTCSWGQLSWEGTISHHQRLVNIALTRHVQSGASPDTYVPCSGVDIPTFATKMYQWASTLTYQGRNMPFALPFRTDPLDTGFVVGTAQIACPSHVAAS